MYILSTLSETPDRVSVYILNQMPISLLALSPLIHCSLCLHTILLHNYTTYSFLCLLILISLIYLFLLLSILLDLYFFHELVLYMDLRLFHKILFSYLHLSNFYSTFLSLFTIHISLFSFSLLS